MSYMYHVRSYIVWRSQPLAKNVGSGTDSVMDLFTWNAEYVYSTDLYSLAFPSCKVASSVFQQQYMYLAAKNGCYN